MEEVATSFLSLSLSLTATPGRTHPGISAHKVFASASNPRTTRDALNEVCLTSDVSVRTDSPKLLYLALRQPTFLRHPESRRAPREVKCLVKKIEILSDKETRNT